ncbi:hypothetical protein FD31_GL001240 [Companilactobacillus nantensis DSM 16982]|uniref:HTH cro/C1-type domain-containing protein n=2 Tax=Companilactobacillus nantensis TaxID=305793 RepID=A0A0R1WI71_9LACO|nr:hypothetical protein FD31_GL001240 [Companilactobacillus nantensis DSM 16982]
MDKDKKWSYIINDHLKWTEGEEMKKLTDDFISDVVRIKGMTSVKELAKLTKVNRWTLSDVLNGRKRNVSNVTYTRLIEYVKDREV